MARLNEIAEANALLYRQAFLGQQLDLLAEEVVEIAEKQYWRGHSANYLNLLLPLDKAESASPGQLLAVRGRALCPEGMLVEML